MRSAQFSGLIQLVHLLCSQAKLRNRYGFILGEAEIMHFVISDTNHIVDFIPVVVRIQAVAGLRFLGVIQTPITARQVESVPVMGQVALSYHINSLIVYLHGNCHIFIQTVGSVQDLLPNLLPLPAVPVRNVSNLSLPNSPSPLRSSPPSQQGHIPNTCVP